MIKWRFPMFIVVPPNHPRLLQIILGLKPMVTWGSPVKKMYVGHGPFTWSWYAESGSQPRKCGVTCEISESKILEKTHRWHLSTLFWFWISENISLWFTIVLDFYVWQALFHIEHAAAIMPRTWDMLRDPAATMALCIYYIHIIYSI